MFTGHCILIIQKDEAKDDVIYFIGDVIQEQKTRETENKKNPWEK